MKNNKLSIVSVCIGILFCEIASAQENTGELTFNEVDSVAELPSVIVLSTNLEKTLYKRKDIEENATGNNDIASLISNMPSVRIDSGTSGAGNRGSLAPESFSIYGESPYQNQFQIDGVEVNNNISPQSREGSQGIAKIGQVTGFSQAYNIDTDLLESVEVYDSNVPIEYGSFLGGVIDAKIKTPKGNNSWKINRKYNSSSLTEQKVSGDQLASWVDGAPGYSPVWRKNFSSIQGDVALPYDTSALISFSRRESTITRRAEDLIFSAGEVPTGKNIKVSSKTSDDVVDNIFLKLNKKIDSTLDVDLLLRQAKRREEGMSHLSNSTSNFGSSNWSNEQDSHGFSFDLKKKVNAGLWQFKSSFDQMNSIRESDSYEMSTHNFYNADDNKSVNKDSARSYTTGTLGTESLEQAQVLAKIRFDFDQFKAFGFSHNPYLGFEYKRTDAQFNRPKDILINSFNHFKTKKSVHVLQTLHKAGVVDVDYQSYGFYLSNNMSWKKLDLYLGVRLDEDDFLENKNISPRGNLTWNIGGAGDHKYQMGWSRYFGADFLGYALQYEKSKLTYRNVLNDVYNPVQNSIKEHSFDGLKTPHSDELFLGYSFDIVSGLNAYAKYIERRSRGGISKISKNSGKNNYYVNNGSSDVKNIIFGFDLVNSINFLGAQWRGGVDYSWQKLKRNVDAVNAWDSDDETPEEQIYVDGRLTTNKERASNEFSIPRKVGLRWSATWGAREWVWGNRVDWSGKRDGIKYVGLLNSNGVGGAKAPGVTLPFYKTEKLPSTWVWNTNITWNPREIKGLSINLEVLNVFNRQEKSGIGSYGAEKSTRYVNGREFWIAAGYEF